MKRAFPHILLALIGNVVLSSQVLASEQEDHHATLQIKSATTVTRAMDVVFRFRDNFTSMPDSEKKDSEKKAEAIDGIVSELEAILETPDSLEERLHAALFLPAFHQGRRMTQKDIEGLRNKVVEWYEEGLADVDRFTCPATYLYTAMVLHTREQYEQSIPVLKRMLSDFPDDPMNNAAKQLLAASLYVSGQENEAREVLNTLPEEMREDTLKRIKKGPPKKRRQAAKTPSAQEESWKDKYYSGWDFLGKNGAKRYKLNSKKPLSLVRADVFKALVCTSESLDIYAIDNGKYPTSLDPLYLNEKLKYLSDKPTDPHSGGLLRYKCSENEIRIWSVGPDGDDDNGRPMDLEVPGSDGDIVVVKSR
ncbi:MAG: tetratricopeptide repeat protein [bacterium]